MSAPSLFRRSYDVLALFAVLNILAMGGLGAMLYTSGAVNPQKLRQIVSIMRGTVLVPADTVVAASPEGDGATDEDAVDPATRTRQSQVDAEVLRLEADRIKAELNQRLALNNSILLRVTTERERFQKERDAAVKMKQQITDRRQAEGFQKQIAIYESLSSKVALQHLLALPDPDDAAKVLLEMNTRKAKKIVEAARSGGQLSKMQDILRRVRQVAPDRSLELAANN